MQDENLKQTMNESALTQVKVIDLTQFIAGPYCTKLMSGFGAEVIKVERPDTGDGMRSRGPFYANEQGLERSIPFLYLNTGKKSITLNLKTSAGLAIFKRLLKDADVLIENFPPKVRLNLGLAYEIIKQWNPKIIMTSISNFGQTGPYKDYKAEEIVEYAMSGLMFLTGDADRAPLAAGPAITQYAAGQTAYAATLMALYKRELTGQGQFIDVSIQECALDLRQLTIMDYLATGAIPKRNSDRHPLCPWQAYPCRDGYAVIVGAPVRHWPRIAAVVGNPELADRKYRRMKDRIRRRYRIEAILKPWLDMHARQDIYHAGHSKGLAFGYVASLKEVLVSPQLQARQYFTQVEHPVVGKHMYCGAPFRPSQTPWQSRRAPLLGEHNESVYCGDLGYSKDEFISMAERGII